MESPFLSLDAGSDASEIVKQEHGDTAPHYKNWRPMRTLFQQPLRVGAGLDVLVVSIPGAPHLQKSLKHKYDTIRLRLAGVPHP